MSYMTTNNARHVQIAKKLARTATLQVVDPSGANYLADGETAVTDESGRIVLTNATAAVAGKKIQVCQRSGDNIFWSGVLDGSNLKSFLGGAPITAVEQVTNVGYNGTSGSIDTINNNEYLMRVIRYDNQSVFANKQMMKFGAYTSDAAATQQEVADGLAISLIANFKREPEKAIKFERLCDAAGVVATVATGTITFVNGSDLVATAGATPATDYAVGGQIRFGTAVTDIVYTVKAVDNTAQTITLDTPYQGASGTLTAANQRKITPVQAAAAVCGLKLTGLPLKFERGVFKYGKSRFEVTLSGMGSTSLAFTTPASEGSGTYESVAEYEWFSSEGVHGKIERLGTPPPTFKQDAVAGIPYGTLYIEVSDTSGDGTIQGVKPSPIQLYIFMDKTGAAYGTASYVGLTSTGVILDAWAGANGGTAQIGNM